MKKYNDRGYMYEEYIVKGKTINQIAEELDACVKTISDKITLFQLNRKSRVFMQLEPYSEEIIDKYNNGAALYDIAESYLGSKSRYDSIKRFLVSKDVKIRSRSEVKNLIDEKYDNAIGGNGRIYTLNFDYFKTWSKNMAYVLGFIASDGNVCNNRLKISVSRRDRDILEKIKEDLEYTGNIFDENSKCKDKEFQTSTLSITSKTLCEDLKNLNITENKSLTLDLEGVIPKNFRLDFIRGYFDGDGSIGFMYPSNSRGTKSKTAQIRFRICSGSKSILELIINEFERQGIKKVNIHSRKDKNLHDIEYSTKSASKIYEMLYYDGAIFLDRKKNKFDEIIAMRNEDLNNKN